MFSNHLLVAEAANERRKALVKQVIVATSMATALYYPKLGVPMYTGQSGREYLFGLLSGHPEPFYNAFRMPISTFLQLNAWATRKGLLTPQRQYADGLSVPEKLAMFVWTISHNASMRDVQDRFQHSSETVSRNFKAVLNALLQLYPDYVTMPRDETPSRIRNDWGKMRCFKDVRGAIDGTHIAAHISAVDQAPFRNRKGYLSQNVLAGCTLDLYFFYVLPGWEGSANDSRVLDNAIANGFPRMKDRILLADGGYGMHSGVITPYKTTRYHLREQGIASQRPKNKEELFNLRHAQLRNAIERIFGVLKKRFRIFDTPPQYDYDMQVELVLVACALHNFIRFWSLGVDDEIYQEVDIELNHIRRIEEKQRWFARRNLGLNLDDLLDDEVNGHGVAGLVPGTELFSRAIDAGATERSLESKRMAAIREKMAEEMWEDYVNYTTGRNS